MSYCVNRPTLDRHKCQQAYLRKFGGYTPARKINTSVFVKNMTALQIIRTRGDSRYGKLFENRNISVSQFSEERVKHYFERNRNSRRMIFGARGWRDGDKPTKLFDILYQRHSPPLPPTPKARTESAKILKM